MTGTNYLPTGCFLSTKAQRQITERYGQYTEARALAQQSEVTGRESLAKDRARVEKLSEIVGHLVSAYGVSMEDIRAIAAAYPFNAGTIEEEDAITDPEEEALDMCYQARFCGAMSWTMYKKAKGTDREAAAAEDLQRSMLDERFTLKRLRMVQDRLEAEARSRGTQYSRREIVWPSEA